MAKVGLEYVVSAILDEAEDGTPSYTKGRYWGPSSQVNLQTNSNNIVDYGDDGAVESDKSLSTIGVTVELNETTNELEAELLGHTIGEDGVLKVTTDDVAPWVGLGFIGKSKRNNEYVMTAVFLHKCQFAAPNNENSTKQESTSFNHTTFEGSAYPLKNHDLYESKEFSGDDALKNAKAWLNGKVGLS